MTLDAVGGELGIYAGTFAVCFLGALIPVSNNELWLVAVTLLLSSPAPLPAVVALAVAGQMLAKSILYVTARAALRRPAGRHHARLERARAAVARWRHRPALVLFSSASLGLPPLYVTTILAAGLDVRFRRFFTIVLLGRVARFSLIVALAWAGGHR